MNKLCAGIKKADKKKSLFSLNFVLIGLALFFVCNKSMIVSEVKNLLSVLHLEKWETFLATLVLPTKTIVEISQVLSIMCILEVALIITTFTFLFVLFFETRGKKIIDVNKYTFVSNKDVENQKDIYKETKKFLC